MPRLVELQTGFTSGEIDPKIRSQSDLKIYGQGLARMRNLARLVGGGVERRPGTMDLAELNSRCRLIEFEFSSTQRYIMALDAGRARVFDINGVLLTTVTGAPWTSTTAFELSYSQSADTMIVTHEAFLWSMIRTGSTSFTISAFSFLHSINDNKIYQPYYKFADDAVTMSSSASTGATTLTASSTLGWGGFVTGHVGQRIRIYDAEVEITGVTSSTVATGTVKGELIGKLELDAFKSQKSSGLIEVQQIHHGLTSGGSVTFSGANDIGQDSAGAGGITGANLTGTFVVTVKDEHNYTFTATAGTANVSEDGGGPNIRFNPAGAATRAWLEPSFNSVRGYPSTACFHEGRLWLGGSTSQPDAYFGSNALQHTRFDVGKGRDGESVQGAAGLEGLSSIRHLVSNGDLQVFTPTTEGVFITGENSPITPGNQRVKRQSVAGSGRIMPQVFDGATLFVQENGLAVSEMVFQDVQAKYAAIPVSTIAQHLLASGIVDSTITVGSSSRSEQYAFFPLTNGAMAVFHSIRSDNIAGWGLWTLGNADVVSAASVGTDVFLCVRRADGAFRLYKIADEPTFYVLDGAVEHTNATEKTNWTVDLRFANRTMHLFSDKGYLGTKAIPVNGDIVTDVPVARLLVGDSYNFELVTLPPRVEVPTGVRDRLLKRIVRAVVEFDQTDSATVNGLSVINRQADGDPADLPTPATGAYIAGLLGYSPSPAIQITQEAPGFARILGLTMEVQV